MATGKVHGFSSVDNVKVESDSIMKIGAIYVSALVFLEKNFLTDNDSSALILSWFQDMYRSNFVATMPVANSNMEFEGGEEIIDGVAHFALPDDQCYKKGIDFFARNGEWRQAEVKFLPPPAL